MRAKDYRRIARENLKGSWCRSAVILLIVLIMTGLIGTAYTYGNLAVSAYHELTQDNINDASEPTVPSETTPADGEEDEGSLLDLGQDDPIPIQIAGYIAFVFGGFFALGHCRYLINQYNGIKASFSDLLEQKWLFSSAFLIKLIRYAFILVFNFFATLGIVPNIYFHYRHCMAMYILLDNPHMRPETAVRESAKLMKGHKWELFCLDLSFVGWHLLGIFTLGVGNLFAGTYASTAHAAFYRNLCPEVTVQAEEEIEETDEQTDMIE